MVCRDIWIARCNGRYYGLYGGWTWFVESLGLSESDLIRLNTWMRAGFEWTLTPIRVYDLNGRMAVLVHEDGKICEILPLAQYASLRARGDLSIHSCLGKLLVYFPDEIQDRP